MENRVAAQKKHKLIRLAKDLKLTLKHVVECLEKAGFENPPSKPNSTLSEDMYTTVLKDLAPDRYVTYLEAAKPKDNTESAESELRHREVDEILHSEDDKIGINLDHLRDLKVIEPTEVEDLDEAAAPEDEEPADEKLEEAAPEPEVKVEKKAAKQAKAPEKSVEDKPAKKAKEAEKSVEEKPAKKAKETEKPADEKPAKKTKKVEKSTDEKPAKKAKKVEESTDETPESVKADEPAKKDDAKLTGRAVVAHDDTDGEKIALPVFCPGRVLGMHVDKNPEPPRRRKKKADAPKAPAAKKTGDAPAPKTAVVAERDPSQSAGSDESSRRKRSSRRTKSEELRLARLEKQREARVSGLTGSGKRKKGKKAKISEEEIRAAVKETTRAMEQGKKRRKHHKVKGVGELNEETNSLRVTEFITTNELADLLDTPVSELIKKTFMLGTMITINQRLDRELIEILCDDYEYQVEFLTEFEDEEEVEEVIDPALLSDRHPVVTVMGHVDHGKTSVLDYIRDENVVAGEAGGITQHIGAYEIEHDGKKITFLDTPGHHSFTAMRARGAQITDVVVLVVSADDRVQEQTKEAIDHALAAKVPIIVAVNKIDLPNSDPQRIRQELSNYNILVEDWGGDYQCVDVSAKQGTNMDALLEAILLRTEMMELKAIAEGPAHGVIIESRLDKGRGTIATLLVQRGVLNKGDIVVAGTASGRVRLMLDERNAPRLTAGTSSPVQLLGLDSVPEAGDTLTVYSSEKDARQVALKRQQIQREQRQQRVSSFSLTALSAEIAKGQIHDLPVIIKGDVDGSIGAIADELMKMQTSEVRVNLIARSVGNITESDVLLAKASGAIIIGFHVTPTPKARELAQRERVDVRLYRIIYEVVEEIHAALEGMLRPDVEEEIIGTAEVRQVFRIAKKAIAGCMVVSGKMTRGLKVRVLRENEVIFDGNYASLKRFKDDAKEVASGFECGIQMEKFNAVQEGDIIQNYDMKEVTRRLDLSAEETE
jgi:translation initiation factor IF-2